MPTRYYGSKSMKYRRPRLGKGARKLNYKQKKQVKKIISNRQELKYALTPTASAASATSTFGVVNLTAIAQGTTDQDRTGDRLQLCGYLDLRLSLTNALGATGDVYNTFRFIVFQWKPNSVPTSSDILLPGPTGARDVYSQYSHDQRQMFTILYDKIFTTSGAGYINTTTNAGNVFNSNGHIVRRLRIPMFSKKVRKYIQFSAGTTVGTNHIYYALASDSSAATHPTYTFSGKVFYRDS